MSVLLKYSQQYRDDPTIFEKQQIHPNKSQQKLLQVFLVLYSKNFGRLELSSTTNNNNWGQSKI